MKNCLSVIVRAMLRIGTLASGQLPTVNEQKDCLETLTEMYRRFLTDGALRQIEDVTAPDGQFQVRPNTRIYFPKPSDEVISWPENAPDLSMIVILDHAHNVTKEMLFDAQTRQWIDIASLELTSPAPLSHRDFIGLSCALAVEIAPEFGQQPDASTAENAARFHNGLINNWSVERHEPWEVYY